MERLLKQHGIWPRRALGQNFLQDRDLLTREVLYAELQGTETVLEIGPGPGNLTEVLLPRAGRVAAIERDRRFAPMLEKLQVRYGNLEILWGDALEIPFPPFDKVVANLPFTPALPLLFKLLELRLARGIMLLQQSLAERLCARVGERGYCRLSVAVGRIAIVELLEVVPPRAFFPPPEVAGALVLVRSMPRSQFAIPSEDFFRLLLERLFTRREAPLAEAAQQLQDFAFVDRALSSLGGKLARKPVYRLTPREFGRIAWAVWGGQRGRLPKK